MSTLAGSLDDRIERASRAPYAVLAAGLAVRTLLAYGPSATPNLPQWLLFAGDPFGAPAIDPAASYITGSVLGPVVAHLLGLDGRAAYVGLHAVAVVAAACASVALARRAVGDAAAAAVAVLLVASPLSNVLVSWLGQPDPFTLVAGSAVALAPLLPSRRVAVGVVLAGGVVGGLAAFEQATLGLVLLTVLVVPTGRRFDRTAAIAALVGLLVGRAGVAWFQSVSDVPYLTRAAVASSIGTDTLLRAFARNLPALVWSLAGAGWLLVVSLARRRRADTIGVAVAVAVALLAAAIAVDETRVATLVLWPVLVRLVVDGVGPAPDRGLRRIVAATLALGLLVPPLVVWEGDVLVSNL